MEQLQQKLEQCRQAILEAGKRLLVTDEISAEEKTDYTNYIFPELWFCPQFIEHTLHKTGFTHPSITGNQVRAAA